MEQNLLQQRRRLPRDIHAVDRILIVEKIHADLQDLIVAPLIYAVRNAGIVNRFFLSADAADIRIPLAAPQQDRKQKRVCRRRFLCQRNDKAQGNHARFELRFADGIQKNAAQQFFSFKRHIDRSFPFSFLKISALSIIPEFLKISTLLSTFSHQNSLRPLIFKK